MTTESLNALYIGHTMEEIILFLGESKQNISWRRMNTYRKSIHVVEFIGEKAVCESTWVFK